MWIVGFAARPRELGDITRGLLLGEGRGSVLDSQTCKVEDRNPLDCYEQHTWLWLIKKKNGNPFPSILGYPQCLPLQHTVPFFPI